MAPQRVAAQQDDVDDEDDRPQADSEILSACVPVEEPHRLVRVPGQDDEKDQRHVEEVAVNVLNHEGEKPLAPIARAGLAHGAARRVGPEALVVRSPIVVAGEAKTGGKGEDQESRRKWNERGEPGWPAAVDPRVRRIGAVSYTHLRA